MIHNVATFKHEKKNSKCMLSLSFKHQYLSTKSECSIEEQSSSNQTYSCFLEKKLNDINKKKYVTERQGSL